MPVGQVGLRDEQPLANLQLALTLISYSGYIPVASMQT
jgi:hypothetical protein